MEVAASAIAFGQAIAAISFGLKKLNTLRNASAEFMDLLNKLSTLNAVSETLRRSLQSLDDAHSDVCDLDIETLKTLKGNLAKVATEMDELATEFIARSKGRDDNGRHMIPKLKWQRSKLDSQNCESKLVICMTTCRDA